MRGGDVKKISDLFAKYKNSLIAPEASVIEAFIEVVDDLCGIKLTKKVVTYQPATKVLSITGKAALRSEIKLHESEIITHLKGRLGSKNAPKVII